MIINEGAAWMPGVRRGMTNRADRLGSFWAARARGRNFFETPASIFLDFSFGKTKYVLVSVVVAAEILSTARGSLVGCPSSPEGARNLSVTLNFFVLTATREIQQAAKEQLGSCRKRCLIL